MILRSRRHNVTQGLGGGPYVFLSSLVHIETRLLLIFSSTRDSNDFLMSHCDTQYRSEKISPGTSMHYDSAHFIGSYYFIVITDGGQHFF